MEYDGADARRTNKVISALPLGSLLIDKFNIRREGAIECLHAIRAGNIRGYSQVVACKDLIDVVRREGAKHILEVVEGLRDAVGIPTTHTMTVQHGDS